MHLFDNSAFDAHEDVHYFSDKTTGLRAIIAIHSTVLGPAAGGCRRWHYESEAQALTDVLRLSRGMSYKNALAGLPFGGGKCVLLCKPGEAKSAEVFQALGAAVDSLGGRYITGEDVGVLRPGHRPGRNPDEIRLRATPGARRRRGRPFPLDGARRLSRHGSGRATKVRRRLARGVDGRRTGRRPRRLPPLQAPRRAGRPSRRRRCECRKPQPGRAAIRRQSSLT